MREAQTRPPGDADSRSHGVPVWLNWVLALLTVPGAGIVILVGLGGVMSTSGCSDRTCAEQGPGDFLFGGMIYGAPVVALLTIVISVFTVRRRWGILVPLCGLALLTADVGILAMSFG
jgi:hypothetical protein